MSAPRIKSWATRWVRARYMQPGMLVHFGEGFLTVEQVTLRANDVALQLIEAEDPFGIGATITMHLPPDFRVSVPENIRYHDEPAPPRQPDASCTADQCAACNGCRS